jgi:hypothetical protein
MGSLNDILEDVHTVTQLHVDILNSKDNFTNIGNDIKCGLKSDIPVCCIIFFCTFWKLFFCFVSFSLVKKFIYWYPPRVTCDWDYVPCFICSILRRSRKVYVCSENDTSCCCFKNIQKEGMK